MAALATRSRSLTSGSNTRWPCRSMDSTRWGIAAFRRFPQMRSAASQIMITRLSDRLIVNALATCLTRNIVVLAKLTEQPDAVFAMVSGDRNELVKDTALVLLGGAPVALSQCDQQFPLCHPAYASTHVTASAFSVTFYLRQPLSLGNVLGEAMRVGH